MQAGLLDHRVSILDVVETNDGHHGFTLTPVILASRIAAAVRPLAGAALERARQLDPRTSHQVRLRFRRGLTSGQTVRLHRPDGDRDFEVVGPPIDVDERRVELQLLCKERPAL